ncbi:MAG: hypothetical protein IPM85_16795 [Chitinophagaceae bacterium]|nr:hypothetical protein [Chitinophagaceae bacterium]
MFADHTAIRIFGFDSFEDISQEHPISLVEDEEERMSITNQLFTDGFVRNKKIKIADSKGNTTIASVSLLLLADENKEALICDGIIEDITEKVKEKNHTDNIVAAFNAKNTILIRPVSDFISPVSLLDWETPLDEINRHLIKRGNGCVLITKNINEIIGIITDSDIQKRIFALNLKADNPALHGYDISCYSGSGTYHRNGSHRNRPAT